MSAQGILFNIQKFSIHDGPGIRTTVFLKGCPLRCQWCSNPESQVAEVQILYDVEKCLHCGSCIKACPKHALLWQEETNRIVIDASMCEGCLTCTALCPGRALTHEGEFTSVDAVVSECLKDIDFYEESGGGVTISGGEGMMQPEFVEALVTRLKKHSIHTTMETTGYAHEDVFRRLAPLFDLLLFDVKQIDPLKHEAGTGVKNALILKNLLWAKEQGLSILPRIPVIPGFNATTQDAETFARFFRGHGFREVQLLPFHQMGEHKYDLLNRDYAFKEQKALHPEDLSAYLQVFLQLDIHAYF